MSKGAGTTKVQTNESIGDLWRQIVSLVIYVVSIVLLAIALGTKGWREEDSKKYGLFSKPISYSSDNTSTINGTSCKSCTCCDDSNEATKVLVTIGVATAVCCPVFIAVYIFLSVKVDKGGIYNYFPLSNATAAVVGGLSTISGCIVYSEKFYEDTGDARYSFILSIVGSLILIVGGIFGIRFPCKSCSSQKVQEDTTRQSGQSGQTGEEMETTVLGAEQTSPKSKDQQL